MKICVSPTKNMKCELKESSTTPLFHQEALQILDWLKQKDVSELMEIYRCNEKIAKENYERFQNQKEKGTALFSFTGLQFKNMQIDAFDSFDLAYAQEHVYIMSGLYGLLRCMDEILAYRLDLENKIELNVFELYQEKILDYLKDSFVINCCSKEYAVWLPKNSITIDFKVSKKGQLKTEATASKMARGQFVYYCIKNKVQTIDELKQFQLLDYQYCDELSNEQNLVFIKEAL